MMNNCRRQAIYVPETISSRRRPNTCAFEEQGRVPRHRRGERIPAERVTSGAVGSLFRLY